MSTQGSVFFFFLSISINCVLYNFFVQEYLLCLGPKVGTGLKLTVLLKGASKGGRATLTNTGTAKETGWPKNCGGHTGA